ncbi:hypothetical protein V8E55_005258 [Tylopilus felleus]
MSFLSNTTAFHHSLEDRIRPHVEEQKRHCLRDADAEAGIDVRSIVNPDASESPGLPSDDYADPFNQASSQTPLHSNLNEGSTTTNMRTVNHSIPTTSTTGVA